MLIIINLLDKQQKKTGHWNKKKLPLNTLNKQFFFSRFNKNLLFIWFYFFVIFFNLGRFWLLGFDLSYALLDTSDV